MQVHRLVTEVEPGPGPVHGLGDGFGPGGVPRLLTDDPVHIQCLLSLKQAACELAPVAIHSVDVEPPTTSDHLLLPHLHGSMFGRRRVRELHTGPLGRLGCLCDSDVCIWFGDGLGGGALRLEGPVFDVGAQVPRAQGVIPRDVTVSDDVGSNGAQRFEVSDDAANRGHQRWCSSREEHGSVQDSRQTTDRVVSGVAVPVRRRLVLVSASDVNVPVPTDEVVVRDVVIVAVQVLFPGYHARRRHSCGAGWERAKSSPCSGSRCPATPRWDRYRPGLRLGQRPSPGA